MSAGEHNRSAELPRLKGRALQLFWSVAAELESTRECGNNEYAELLAEFLAELELDVQQRGELQALRLGMRVIQGIRKRTGLDINAVCRLLEAIGLDIPALEGHLRQLDAAGHIPTEGHQCQ